MSMQRCPSCDNHPLGNGYVANIETRGGVELEATICGECGMVYVDKPGEQLTDAVVSADA